MKNVTPVAAGCAVVAVPWLMILLGALLVVNVWRDHGTPVVLRINNPVLVLSPRGELGTLTDGIILGDACREVKR